MMGWMLSWFLCVEAVCGTLWCGGRCGCLDVWFTVVLICLRDCRELPVIFDQEVVFGCRY